MPIALRSRPPGDLAPISRDYPLSRGGPGFIQQINHDQRDARLGDIARPGWITHRLPETGRIGQRDPDVQHRQWQTGESDLHRGDDGQQHIEQSDREKQLPPESPWQQETERRDVTPEQPGRRGHQILMRKPQDETGRDHRKSPTRESSDACATRGDQLKNAMAHRDVGSTLTRFPQRAIRRPQCIRRAACDRIRWIPRPGNNPRRWKPR